MHTFLRQAAGFLYPARCVLCDSILRPGERFLCPACRGTVLPARHGFPNGFAPFLYTGEIQRSVLRMKYGGRAEYAAFYAAAIRLVGGDWLASFAPQVLVPVPVHRQRARMRGYNQAEELALRLEQETGIPVAADLVTRARKTRAQKGLGRAARRENLRGAFELLSKRAMPERILLVDDIYTTGATIGELTLVLASGGAKEIGAVCAARAGEGDLPVSDDSAILL